MKAGFGALGLLACLLFLGGCFDATAIVLLMRNSNKKNSSSTPPAAPPPDPLYHVWIASIPDAPTALAQQSEQQANGGNPDATVWTEIGTGSASAEFAPTQSPGSYNAILVQASSAQPYHLDSVEILDSSDATIAVAGGTVYDNGMTTNPSNMLGAPDGVTADTAATGGSFACLFSLFGGPIAKFRVNIWSAAQGPGDVLWISQVVRAGNQNPGGAAVDASGNLYVMFDEPAGASKSVFAAEIDPTGALLGTTSILTGMTASAGSHSIAIHTDGSIYIAATAGNGTIVTRKYSAGLASQLWSVTASSGLGSDRVQAHSLALDGSGNAIVAGGMNTLADGIDPWMGKLSSASGSTLWTQVPSLLTPDPNSCWWWGAATDGSGNVYSTGNLGSLASSNIEVLTRESAGSNGAADWSNQFSDPSTLPSTGHQVALDGSGNLYVGGTLGTSSQGKNGILLQYSPSGFTTSFVTFDGTASLDDEILGIAVDADGTVYAVGYETVVGPLQVLWIRKYDPDGGILWTRTYAGAGSSQAVDVLLGPTWITVVGFETLSGGDMNLHVRHYEK